jgi:cation:H+ antiporter
MPSMLLTIGLALAGLILLTFAADHLVLGAARLAGRLHISPVVVGVVVIGLGTSSPEFLVSGLAATQGDAGLGLGNLVGSNILNLTLILGAAALIAPVAVRSSVVRREAPLSVAAVALFALLLRLRVDALMGTILAVGTVVAVGLLVRLARETPDPALGGEVSDFLDGKPRHRLPRETIRALLGLAGTIGGAQLLVTNAAEVAGRLGVSDVVIGFTLVALGTSLPELVTAVQAQRRGETDLLVGNLLGSNLFNSLAGGALVGLLTTRPGPGGVAPALLVAMVFISLLAWALLFRGYRVTRVEAGVLLIAYALTLPLLL